MSSKSSLKAERAPKGSAAKKQKTAGPSPDLTDDQTIKLKKLLDKLNVKKVELDRILEEGGENPNVPKPLVDGGALRRATMVEAISVVEMAIQDKKGKVSDLTKSSKEATDAADNTIATLTNIIHALTAMNVD